MSGPPNDVSPEPVNSVPRQSSDKEAGHQSTQAAPQGISESMDGSTATSQNTPDWIRLAEAELAQLAESARQGSLPGLGQIIHVATGIVDSLHNNDKLLTQVFTGSSVSPLITNPIHVSVLAAKVGMGLGWNREELSHLALAGLLHDIGMFSLPESLLMKPEPLSTSERTFMEQHPEFGAQLLHALGTDYDWLAEVVAQEHERWAGQGYPKKLRGSAIHPYAQIIGIADVFDALVSSRPYREISLPHTAIRTILVEEQTGFSREIIKALIEQLSIYPLGTHVRLNTGEVGVVVELKPKRPLRPIIQISQTEDQSHSQTKVVDLSTSTLVHVVEVVRPAEVA